MAQEWRLNCLHFVVGMLYYSKVGIRSSVGRHNGVLPTGRQSTIFDDRQWIPFAVDHRNSHGCFHSGLLAPRRDGFRGSQEGFGGLETVLDIGSELQW